MQKKLDDSGITELIETFCKKNSSCAYLKSPNKESIKCESGYDSYTDSSGNKMCKKKIGVPISEFGIKSCVSGKLMDGACYSIKDPSGGSDGCESGYKLYKDSTGKQKCKKNLSDSEITELMLKVCDTNSSNCQYIKKQIEKAGSGLGDPNLGEQQKGCDVIPPVIRKWINNILNFVRYVALALVIALGTLDFMKAAGSGEGDAMKKAGQSFMKRMIAVVVLFLLPVIVDFILNMINIYGVDTNNIDCL